MLESLFNHVNISASLFGGILIGLSATLLLLFNGRIAGICGIAYGLFNQVQGDKIWRWLFLVSLVLGTFLYHWISDAPIPKITTVSLPLLLSGAFLVGFGTQIGSGCTSGHGVCGLARFSMRSLASTLLFVIFGMISMIVFKQILGVI
jgi:uncharacterized protein